MDAKRRFAHIHAMMMTFFISTRRGRLSGSRCVQHHAGNSVVKESRMCATAACANGPGATIHFVHTHSLIMPLARMQNRFERGARPLAQRAGHVCTTFFVF